MIINLQGNFEGLNFNRNIFYGSEDQRIYQLSLDEKDAYSKLEKQLKAFGLDEQIKNIGSKETNYMDGGWCIVRENDFWLVYYSEHNVHSQLSIFTSPYSAVNFYLWNLISKAEEKISYIGRITRG